MTETLVSVLGEDGRLVAAAPKIPDADLLRMFRHIVRMRVLDQRMLSLQRQGRIGFYGTAAGQEAAVTGSAYVARDSDWIFPALREMGVSLWRGTTTEEIVCQLIGNRGDVLIGRQMPCHFSDRRVNVVAWSSVIGTQLVHAMGAAWAAQIEKKDDVMMGYMGDGASSSADFHAAANFAGVMKLPVVFFCQNNQWAISVPLSRQTASSSIAIKATAYGFPGVRVDGNDLLAVIQVTREAVDRARRGEGPTLVEAVTFRMGGHSSSDDPTRYREAALVAEWERKDPLARLRTYLRSLGALKDGDEETMTAEINDEIGSAIKAAEAQPAPTIESLFHDVYAKVPKHLEEQMRYAVAMGEGQKFEGAFPL
ncbi:MAG TPA: thiamine pyrophosphate-dependent dehydrogenase E1 component subunit alpha [Candidatus Udaeobacter sp.]|nr:thiamine pyrophosphate-dependent dehydrogenase E1 component subunit alpha [Candidatus Udaeobacter sp.]